MNSEEQKVGIETKLFSGIKKGDIKDIPAHCVPRTCIAKITLLEIFLNEEFDFPSPLELSLSIDSGKSKLSTGAIHIPIKQEEENESKNQKQNKNTKTTIQTMKQQRKSTPITITPSKNDKKNISNKLESSNLILPFTENDSQLIYQLAYVFSFRYLHNLKYSDNILNIHLQRTKKRGKKKSTIGIGKINLADVLQMTFDSSLKLIEPNTNNLRAKINIRVVTIPLKIGALLNIQNEEVNDIDGEDFEEKDKHSSDSDDLQYLIEGPELTQIEPKQKKKRFGKLRNKLKFGARFRKGIKKKGGKQENEIISIQNQNQNQNQSNNDLNQMIKEEDSSDKEIINLTKNLEQEKQGNESTEKIEQESQSETPIKFMNEENKSLKSSLKKSNSANSYPLISFESVTRTLQNLFNSSKTVENIFLLKAGKRRTQKLLPWINLSSLQGKLIWIQNFLDIQQTFSTVVKYQQKIKTNRTPFKIVVLGSDVFITEILRSYVDILSKTQKPLELIKFYILPIGKKIDIALHIASLDSQYRTLFIHSNWKNLFDEQEKFTNQEIEFIVSSMDKYIYGGKYTTLLNINEAFLTIKGEDSDSLIIQKTIPFLKSMKIGEQKDFEKQNEHVSEPPRVSLDYWVRHQKDKKEIKEKDEKKKESKKERKDKKITKHVTLEFVVATPLRTIALALKLDQNELPISGESFSLLTVYTDKKRNLSSKKETKYQRRALQISKLLAKTLDNKKGFVVNIDSIDWTGVSLITIRPQWNSQTKYFPLAVFNKV